MFNRLSIWSLIICTWLVTLPCRSAEPAANLTGTPTTSSCGNTEVSKALRQTILGTIQDEVSRRTAPEPVTIEETDLQLQVCPQPGLVDSRPVIKNAEYDASRDVTLFWLGSAMKDSKLPPLIVAVHKQRSAKVLIARHSVRGGQAVSMSDFVEVTQSSGNLLSPGAQLWGANTEAPLAQTSIRKPDSARLPKAPVLVKVGVPAELVLSGQNFRGRMMVIPTGSGRMGDELRVRDPGTRNILRARVAGANQLEAIF